MNDLRVIRDGLFRSIDRWAPEIISAPPRSTPRCGIAQKCYSQIDKMLEICVDESVIACGPEGTVATNTCAGGKPLARLTLGERVQILEKLDSCLGRKMEGLVDLPGSRLLGAKGHQIASPTSQRSKSIHSQLCRCAACRCNRVARES